MKYIRVSLLGCFSLSIFLLTSCLTRKNALPPNRTVTAKGTILTDATTSRKDVRTGNRLLEGYAEVLGVAPSQLKTAALYRYIDEWMGTPHRSGGVSRHGLDCSAFVGLVMRDVYVNAVP